MICAACVNIDPSVFAETQTFFIASQWNLIAFQVVPDPPEPESVFNTLTGFQEVWSYDATFGLWQRYVKPSGGAVQQGNDGLANALLEMEPIEPGRAYWVKASQPSTWLVSGAVPKGVLLPGLNLQSGWNLIGIPVGAASVTNVEPVSLLAVLNAAGFDYDTMLTYEDQTFRKMFRPQDTNSPLTGLPPDLPFPSFDLQKDLGRGYWIHVLDPAILRPRLVATVRSDIDAEPTNNFPGKEDLNVSGVRAPAKPKSVQEQDLIRFFPGDDVQKLSISNLGDGTNSGGGILIWEAVWVPTTDTDTSEPWIRLFSSPDQHELRNEQGVLLSAYTNLTGVTTIETDIVYLRLDRKNLGRGPHQGTLLLRTSVGDRSYKVVAEVGGLDGDFKGYAVIQSVNGKRNPVPDIDLNVSFYEDNKVDGLLRGVIDSSQALLWPVDVPLIGYRVANEGNQFILGGSFVLPPGDQNGEPFDKWDENDSTAGADIDWLNDQRLDVRNPFPFPVQRTVSFHGALIKANPIEGYILEGEYTEVVHGMSRQPLLLSGYFHLARQAARPLSSRRSIDQDTGVEPVISKKNDGIPLAVPVGASRTNSVSIETEMDLQAIQVTLAFSTPLAHSRFLVKLRSPGPNPVELVLYDGTNPANAINPKLLESVAFPLDRPTHGDLDQFLRNVPRTKTGTSPGTFWSLLIINSGSQTVSLAKWSLRLEGQPVTDVFGVVKDGSTPLAGVTVSLDGTPISLYSSVTGADGSFRLSRVPLLPLNFSGSRPGYRAVNPANPGLSPMFTRPFVGQPGLTFTALETALIARFNPLAGAPPALAGVPGFLSGTTNSRFELQLRSETAGHPTIAAGPLDGLVGATIEFYAVNPVATVRWDFGDGTSANQTVTNHVFQAAGLYRVKLFSPANSATPQDTVQVVVRPAPGHAPQKPADLGGEPTGLGAQTANTNYTAYLFQPFFTTAGVLPARKVGTDPQTGADRYRADISPQNVFAADETNQFGAAFVSIMPIQQAYSASMDIDLAPHVSPPNVSKQFESDGFVPLASPRFDISINVNNQGFNNEDFNYSLIEDLWRNTRTQDGSLEYRLDPQNGLIVWGNSLINPNQNYAGQIYQARDGADFVVNRNDDTFHPHPGTTAHSDLSNHQIVTHYRLACSIGAGFLTAPTPSTSVKSAKPRRSQPDNPFDAELLAAPGPVARNLYFQLNTGVFGVP
jgi:hypothetical protein